MIFSLRTSKRGLLAELNHAVSIPATKSGSATENYVLLDASGPQPVLFYTNLGESFSAPFAGAAEVSGVVAVPLRKLHDYIRLLPEGEMMLTASAQDFVLVTAGRSRTRFPAIPASQYPTHQPAPASALDIDADILGALLRRTQFAVSEDTSRFAFNGVLLSATSSLLKAVATNGHRMAYIETTEFSAQADFEVLVPRSVIAPVMAIAVSGGAERVRISADQSSVYFAAGKRQISARRIAGNFPSYQAVLPVSHSHSLELPRKEFLLTLERTIQFTDARTSAVKFRADRAGLEISASSSDIGESVEVFESSGPEVEFMDGYRADYISDFLKVIETSSTVSFSFNGSGSAAEFQPRQHGGSFLYRYIVMPCKI